MDKIKTMIENQQFENIEALVEELKKIGKVSNVDTITLSDEGRNE